MSSPDFRVEGGDKRSGKFTRRGIIEPIDNITEGVEVSSPGIDVTDTISESVEVTETES